jgi:hypothetical protein
MGLINDILLEQHPQSDWHIIPLPWYERPKSEGAWPEIKWRAGSGIEPCVEDVNWKLFNDSVDPCSDQQSILEIRSEKVAASPCHILNDLEAMLEEQNEPDFCHRPTMDAYDVAQQIIKNSHTHYIGSVPTPTIAPDGDGGIRIEWQLGRRIVRLVVPASKDEKPYVYSRRDGPSDIDEPATGEELSRRLRTIFAD